MISELEHLLHKLESLSSNPQLPPKTLVTWHAFNVSAVGGGDGTSLGLPEHQSSPTFSEKLLAMKELD